MSGDDWADTADRELAEGMAQRNCRSCGCMHDGLARIRNALAATGADPELLDSVREWQDELEAVTVDCRGCAHCYPAAATDAASDGVDDARVLSASTEADVAAAGSGPDAGDATGDADATARDPLAAWPPLPGDYHEMCTGADCPVAVSTLDDAALADELAARAPGTLCIVGRTRTENLGVEKLVRNVVANPTIRVLLVAGPDPEGHESGGTLRALAEEGVTDEMAVAGAPGSRPVLANATREEVSAFRERVDVVDLVGCTDPETILERVRAEAETACTCGECGPAASADERGPDAPGEAGFPDATAVTTASRVGADPSEPVRMDPAGYFVVVPRPDAGTVVCEHYDYHHERQHVVEGASASDVYREVVERDLVTRLDHAAYLGAELTKAELAVEEGLDYEQDGVPGGE
jgi:tetrahydromethanopterin S-methyltransferase subunit A